MLYNQAFEELLNGKYLQRKLWAHEKKYIVLMPGMNSLWMIMTLPNPNAGNWLPLIEDMKASDWEVIDKLEEVEAPKVEEAVAA